MVTTTCSATDLQPNKELENVLSHLCAKFRPRLFFSCWYDVFLFQLGRLLSCAAICIHITLT